MSLTQSTLFKINASFLIFVILFQGLFFNILHYSLGLSQLTILIQLFILIEVIFLLFWAALKINLVNMRLLIFLILTYISFLLGTSIINLDTLNMQSVLTIFVYAFPFFMFYLGKHFRRKEIIDFYFICFFAVICISLLQMFFASFLPSFLLYVPSFINPERTDQSFFSGFVFNRPNGLIGNPIEFSTFMNLNIIFLFWWISESNSNKKYFLRFLLSVSIIIVVLSLSRFAIAILLFNLFFYIMFFIKNRRIRLYSFMALLIAISILLIFRQELILIDAILAKFDGRDSWARESNAEHIRDYMHVFELSSENIKNMIFGLGPGYNNKFDIVTDGFHFIILLDTGIIGALLFYLLAVLFFLNNFPKNRYKIILALLIILFLASGFINSGYLNKTVAFLFWFIVGVISSEGVNIKSRRELHVPS